MTPRYFTSFFVGITLSNIYSFSGKWKDLLLVKMIVSLLSPLISNLHFLHQFSILFRASCNLLWSIVGLLELEKMAVSSAYIANSVFWIFGKSAVYMSVGDRIEPCGTPAWMIFDEKVVFAIATWNFLFFRNSCMIFVRAAGTFCRYSCILMY